ncbi:MAG: VIT family protein [Planctomycetaceae bacterium]
MTRARFHQEFHKTDRIGWLRAAVLGANDGIVSVASLVVGVASSSPDRNSVLLAGLAGLAAGAMSMAAGEYVSVRSQADTEGADRKREEQELRENPDGELDELTFIYVKRGLDEPLARQVAAQLMERDALTTHLRDELGITEQLAARPIQAAVASAMSFAVGAGMPLIVAMLVAEKWIVVAVGFTTVLCLLLLGGISAWTGGASIPRGAMRVTFWGVAAMAMTAIIGWMFGVSVG